MIDPRIFEPPMTDEDWSPNNIDEFEPGTEIFYGDCGSWEWHEHMDHYEPLIRCGNYLYPEVYR